MNQKKIFFELIRVAIGNAVCLSHTPAAKEWQMLYEMAKKQSLVGICFAGVQYLITNHPSLTANLSESLHLQWMGMAAKIQQRNEVVNRQCVELQVKLSDCGLRSCILKGQSVAVLYGQHLSGLRQSGDIDLWVDAPKEKVVELAREMGITEKAGYLHVGTKFKDTDVELHYRPTYMRNPFHNKLVQEISESFKDKWIRRDGLMVPSLEFDVIYQLSHIYRHLFGSGIGLRQLIDYYFTLRAVPGGFNVSEVSSNLNELGLKNIAGAVMYVLQVVFGMDEQSMICPPDEIRGKELLTHVMQTGNFGKRDKEQKVARQSLLGTIVYKVRQLWVLLRYYPAETVFASYWALKG